MRTHPALTPSILALAGLLFAGCGGSSSGGGSSSSTAAGSTAPVVTAVGPLTKKALNFEKTMKSQHLGLGQVQDVRVDASGAVTRMGNAPSRVLWTGVYAGSQAMRYRATNDPDALANLEAALWTLHELHEITGKPGVIARGYDLPSIETNGWPGAGRFSQYNHNKGKTSRDQYAGWFHGIAQGFDHIQDPTLRQALQDDVRAVCDKLMADDLAMKTPWGPNNTPEVFFQLKPDYFYQDQINAHTWATVDDFPFNLITKSVPYDPQLAAAIQNVSVPPVRAGEAMRAIFFFTVAEHVTGDVRYGDYKRQLLFQRDYLQVIEDYLTITDDLLHGRNLQVAERAVRQLFDAITQILSAYLRATGTSSLITQYLIPLVANSLSGWLADLLTDLIAWIHNPSSASTVQQLVAQGRIVALLLNLFGQQQLAQDINQALTTYGPHLNHQGLIDLARTVRSHLGANLTLLPLASTMRLEQDPTVVARYRAVLDRYWAYLATDHNPIVNLVHHGYGAQFGIDDVAHTLEALRRYPTDMRLREVDNSGWPGLVVSPWPDRFGRVGRIALTPEYFPIDHRAPDIFPWRGHPRQIKSGANRPDHHVAPLGYLAPYWLARDLGVITAAD
jgi:hypothetical protein